eukprot:TRINITY_DN4478_c0_g1_i19.p1 TRINITY_DN4478_c0_g1~~TRINITY_DN4478_c0_g1_i19.p1  ORF type:complete len:152 (-),score=34.10 TRINITY_DN4478_c0_g1_i19:71-526(-)
MLRLLKLGRILRPLRVPAALITTQIDPKEPKKKLDPDFDPDVHMYDFCDQEPFSMIPREYPYNSEIYPLRMPEIRTRIMYVLSQFEKVPLTEHFNWHGKFDEDHGLDSLDVIAIITTIEEEFHTVFEDVAFDNFQTFEDVADFISTLHNAY